MPYLRDLGVSHLYLSPSLQAREGSTHGYDVVDPTHISESLGGEQEFRALCGAARDDGLGVVLDIVPNHMAATDESPFWRDPLWRARFFDLDWRTGSHRRFFDVGELGGVRVQDPEVWEVTHTKVIELAQEGLLDGLRVDHIDGLAGPRRYLERLREAGIEHVWVEKILEPGEQLRDWPVEGTTGYEFLNEVCALFVDPAGEEPLTELYEEISGDRRAFDEIARECKLHEASTTFSEEAERLQSLLPSLDVDLPAALAALPVYRTYVEPYTGRVENADRAAVEQAALPAELARLLLLEERGHDAFVVRFQQTTPPVHAKGVEDTAFYRFNRLLALNEVGGAPGRFTHVGRGVPPLQPRARREVPAPPARDDDPRREALGRRPCPARLPRGPAPGVGVARAAAARRLAGRERGVPDPADGRRRVAADRRAPRALSREGAPRGEGAHELDRPGPRVGGGRAGLRRKVARGRGGSCLRRAARGPTASASRSG